jgi:hypothetical protein
VSGELDPRLQRGSMHEDLRRGIEVHAASDRTFGLVMAAACGLAGLWPLLHHRPVRGAALVLCAVFAAISGIRSAWLHPLNRFWTALAMGLSRVTTPLVCGLLFYLVVTPVAYIMRWSGKDPMRLSWDPRGATYWLERPPEHAPARESMRMQF